MLLIRNKKEVKWFRQFQRQATARRKRKKTQKKCSHPLLRAAAYFPALLIPGAPTPCTAASCRVRAACCAVCRRSPVVAIAPQHHLPPITKSWFLSAYCRTRLPSCFSRSGFLACGCRRRRPPSSCFCLTDSSGCSCQSSFGLARHISGVQLSSSALL